MCWWQCVLEQRECSRVECGWSKDMWIRICENVKMCGMGMGNVCKIRFVTNIAKRIYVEFFSTIRKEPCGVWCMYCMYVSGLFSVWCSVCCCV